MQLHTGMYGHMLESLHWNCFKSVPCKFVFVLHFSIVILKCLIDKFLWLSLKMVVFSLKMFCADLKERSGCSHYMYIFFIFLFQHDQCYTNFPFLADHHLTKLFLWQVLLLTEQWHFWGSSCDFDSSLTQTSLYFVHILMERKKCSKACTIMTVDWNLILVQHAD